MAIYFLGFVILVIMMLALDLGVFHRRDVVISTKSALLWTVFFIAISLLFNALVYVFYENHWLGIGTTVGLPTTGLDAAIAFFTAYVVEKSLSVDNIFVIAMIFTYFQVSPKYQHRVLFWGILGALAMRGVMIALGIAAIERFSWVTYILGGLLIVTAVRMMVAQQDRLKPEKNLAIRIVSKYLPITKEFHGHRFLIKHERRWFATPLFLALVLIESTDLLFAIDSIPAVLAITLDPFIVFTSNVFAILGMRSLYFAVASLLDKFRYLKQSLIFILGFVGIKMVVANHVAIDAIASLWIIIGILGIGIGASALSALEQALRDEARKPGGFAYKRRIIWRFFFGVAVLTVVSVGALMVLVPHKAFPIMLAGLLALGAEFALARAFLNRVHKHDREKE